MIVAGGLFVLWVAALAFLTVTTANPPQINLAQLARARHIVTARVDDTASGKVTVTRWWTPAGPENTLTIANLSETPAVAGESYLLPLRNHPIERGRYQVVSDLERDLPPYIYPAVPEIERQLQAWLTPSAPQ